eukprot:3402508-Rhodomonas_salina.1
MVSRARVLPLVVLVVLVIACFVGVDGKKKKVRMKRPSHARIASEGLISRASRCIPLSSSAQSNTKEQPHSLCSLTFWRLGLGCRRCLCEPQSFVGDSPCLYTRRKAYASWVTLDDLLASAEVQGEQECGRRSAPRSRSMRNCELLALTQRFRTQ